MGWGLCEDPVDLSQFGELFKAIHITQLEALRDADRFWYETYLLEDEMDRIAGVTLADIIRANTNIGNKLQDNVFFVVANGGGGNSGGGNDRGGDNGGGRNGGGNNP